MGPEGGAEKDRGDEFHQPAEAGVQEGVPLRWLMWVQRSQGTSVMLVGTASQTQSGGGCHAPGFPDPANRGPEGEVKFPRVSW